jgi:hypothetical protein
MIVRFFKGAYNISGAFMFLDTHWERSIYYCDVEIDCRLKKYPYGPEEKTHWVYDTDENGKIKEPIRFIERPGPRPGPIWDEL